MTLSDPQAFLYCAALDFWQKEKNGEHKPENLSNPRRYLTHSHYGSSP